MKNLSDQKLFNINMLRAIAEAKVMTLEKYGKNDNLSRAQIVAKILSDDNCFAEMTLDESVQVLMALGFKPETAHWQAENFYRQYHINNKKLSHIKK